MNRRPECHQLVGGLHFSDVNRLMEEMVKEMSEALRGIPEAKVAHNVYGLYYVITQIEAEIQDEPRRALGQRIRRIEGVRSTITMRVSN